MPVNKRNYQKQADHLEIDRAIRDIKIRQQGKADWRIGNGRPAGSGTAKEKVQEWQQHPDGRKVDCQRATGLDPKTVRKWWRKEGTQENGE